jgi:hypothetical protein
MFRTTIEALKNYEQHTEKMLLMLYLRFEKLHFVVSMANDPSSHFAHVPSAGLGRLESRLAICSQEMHEEQWLIKFHLVDELKRGSQDALESYNAYLKELPLYRKRYQRARKAFDAYLDK